MQATQPTSNKVPLHRWLIFTGLSLVILLAAAACELKGNSAPKGQSSSALGFLRNIPDTPENRKFAAFGDAAAWHASWGVPRIASVEELNNLTDVPRAYWIGIMQMQTLPPDSLDFTYMMNENYKGLYGFDLFSIDRYAYAGRPPQTVSVLEFHTDRQAIADALTARGYAEQETAPGWVLYSLNKDYAVNLEAKNHAEQMGNLNRILLSDHFMIVGKATEVVAPDLEATAGKTPSLGDDKNYIASVQALQDSSLKDAGELMGVIWVDGQEFASPDYFFGLNSGAPTNGLLEKYGLNTDLPAYTLAAFGTRHSQKDGVTSLILALIFPKGTDAKAAAQVLQTRLEKADSLSMKKPFLEVMNAASVKVYAVQAGGLPVTLAVLRIKDPVIKESTNGIRPIARVRSWMEFIERRDMMFLFTH